MSWFQRILGLAKPVVTSVPDEKQPAQASSEAPAAGNYTVPCRASRFLSNGAMVKVIQKAEAMRNPKITQSPKTSCAITIDLGEPVGEGWEKGTAEYLGTTTRAVVRFDPKTGKPFNAFPIFDQGKKQNRPSPAGQAQGAEQVDLSVFDSAIAWLDFVLHHPTFDMNDWDTALPLLPSAFTQRVDLCDQQVPGVADGFKLAYQYILNEWDDERLEAWWSRRMDFGLPGTTRQFLTFLWESLYPGEPWQRSFSSDVEVLPEG
ncbi:MAG: hypothetical protein ACOY94_28895 [Bacillota bacterium]